MAAGVLWMRLPLPMALDHVNVYALDDGDGWTVVDTGFDTAAAARLWEALLAGPLAGKPVTRVIVTHHHPDHVGLAGWFMDARRRACDHPHRLADGADADAGRAGTPHARRSPSGARPGWTGGCLDERAAASGRSISPTCVAAAAAGLSPGWRGRRRSASAGATGTSRMGDGHAPEHATFWSRDDDLVIGGDQLLPSISPNLGVYRDRTRGRSGAAGWKAASGCALLAEATSWCCPATSCPTPGLPLRLAQMIDNHHGALARLRAHLATPRTAADCFAPLFKRRSARRNTGWRWSRRWRTSQSAAPPRPHRRSGGHKGRRHAVGGVTASPHCASTCGEHRRTR